jgi:hypothetical protein
VYSGRMFRSVYFTWSASGLKHEAFYSTPETKLQTVVTLNDDS